MAIEAFGSQRRWQYLVASVFSVFEEVPIRGGGKVRWDGHKVGSRADVYLGAEVAYSACRHARPGISRDWNVREQSTISLLRFVIFSIVDNL